MTDGSGPSSRNRLGIGHRLGRGGEGVVHALAADPTRAIKIYAAPDPAREAKVRAMVEANLAARCPGVAFPEQAVYGETGAFAGFVMPLIAGAHPVHELFSPSSRRRVFPGVDWRFLVRAAINTARVVGRVHEVGAVIGDVNGSGVLVDRRAIATMIDADSFQLDPSHLCRVGVPEYTPPELQGLRLDGVVRTVAHDAFGLAVLLFQILFLGRHPHAGVPRGRDVPLVDAIRQHMFAHSRIQPGRLLPPPGTLKLDDLPNGLDLLFERAFLSGGIRPSPAEWVPALEDLERSVTPCSRKEGHHKPDAGKPCPWCRIEDQTGVPTFGSGATPRGTRSAAEDRDVAVITAMSVLARARAEAGEAASPSSIPRADRPSQRAVKALQIEGHLAQAAGLGVRCISPTGTRAKGFISDHRAARRELDGALDEWRERVGAWAASRLATGLANELTRRNQAAVRHQRHLAAVADGVREEWILRELGRMPIPAERIPGLGRRGLVKLACSGIGSAADLSRTELEQVERVGERLIAALLLWRGDREAEIRRRYRPDPDSVARARRRLEVAWLEEKRVSDQRILGLSGELVRALDALRDRAMLPDARLAAALAAHAQSSTDLRYLGLSPPALTPASPAASTGAKRSPASSGAKAKKAAKSGRQPCPACGGPMVRRWARTGTTAQSFFLGCASYPACTGSRPLKARRP